MEYHTLAFFGTCYLKGTSMKQESILCSAWILQCPVDGIDNERVQGAGFLAVGCGSKSFSCFEDYSIPFIRDVEPQTSTSICSGEV